ncbi:hypothetical protein LINPERHAP2_LOCUS23706 [Linum perenne]
MSSTSRAWMSAATVGAVEALKDQGFCRWNYAIRSIQQHSKNKIRSPSRSVRKLYRGDRGNRAEGLGRVGMKGSETEDGVRTVLFFSCWGPCWGPYN